MIQGSRKVTARDYNVDLPLVIIQEDDKNHIFTNKAGADLFSNRVFLDYESEDEEIKKLIIINNKDDSDIYYTVNDVSYVLSYRKSRHLKKSVSGGTITSKPIRSYMAPGIYLIEPATLNIEILDVHGAYEAKFLCNTIEDLYKLMNSSNDSNSNVNAVTDNVDQFDHAPKQANIDLENN